MSQEGRMNSECVINKSNKNVARVADYYQMVAQRSGK